MPAQRTPEPEILPPGTEPHPRSQSSSQPPLQPRSPRGAELFNDATLDTLSHILDDFLRIPGTPIRFGLDGLIGLIPGIGDIIGAMASWIILLAAWMRGVPRVTLARMVMNVAVETIVGTVPILGDAFDVAWKANRRNFALLQRASEPVSEQKRKRHALTDWLFLLGMFVAVLALLAIPLALLAYIAGKFFTMGTHHV